MTDFFLIWYWPSMVGLSFLGLGWMLAVGLAVKDFFSVKSKSKTWADWVFLAGLVGMVLASLEICRWFLPLEPSFGLESSGVNLVWFASLILAFLGLTSLPFTLSTLILKVFFHRPLSQWFGRFLLLIPLSLLVTFMALIWYDEFNNPVASIYFQLHAAIKNTCLLDPERRNCPTKLAEIAYIEPAEYKRLAGRTDFTYVYDPGTNQYTFMARVSAKRVVVFDQRLIQTEGVDFKEYEILTWGQDRIKDPPTFSGPWQLSEWQHWWGR